jgi:signal transduction histidine kinase
MNQDYQLVFMDDRFRAFLGINLEAEPRAREFWLEHIHPDDVPYILKNSRSILEGGLDSFAAEYRYLHPQRGTIWVHHLSRVLERSHSGSAKRVVGVMRDVTQRKRAEIVLKQSEAELKDNQKDLRRLAGKLISVKEEELRRLSRELHDDLTQRLAVIAIEAGKLELQLKAAKGTRLDFPIQSVCHIKEQLIGVSEDVHRISRQLHPSIIDDLGLVRAIESECATLQKRENIEVDFSFEKIPKTVSQNISLCIYRILQEALKNIISHSQALTCAVSLKKTRNKLRLVIKDQGVGFDPLKVREKAGLGLSSMRERVLLVGGFFSIDSRPGQGTTVLVTIPLDQGET